MSNKSETEKIKKALKEKEELIKKKYKEEFYNLVSDAIEETLKAAEQATPINKMKGASNPGRLYEAWKKDSDKKAKMENDVITFTLRNKVPYAIWVDKGHSLTQHYVPGLFINDDGELQYEKGHSGIVVGTQTEWVEGKRMSDKAKKAFYKYLKKNYYKRLKDIWNNT